MNRVRTIGWTMLLLAAAGCGKSEVDSDGSIPGGPGLAPAPSFGDGIYAAAYDGDDANPGTPSAPVRSINTAIRKAQAAGKSDVYVFGGAFNGSYAEVVVLVPGINVHGGYCFTGVAQTPDTVACRTSIVGGTPSLVGVDIDEPTLVENVEIHALPAAQSGGDAEGFFEVPGVGCVGRGLRPERLAECTRKVDADGRLAPLSSVGVVLAGSSEVFFRNVRVQSADAADGLPGFDGEAGANGMTPLAGGAPGSKDYQAGSGAKAVAPAACPEARGGNGGQGGRFRWNDPNKSYFEVCPQQDPNTPPSQLLFCNLSGKLTAGLYHRGGDGADSFLGAGGASFAPAFIGAQRGANGMNGTDGTIGAEGEAGANGGADGVYGIDLETLAAADGESGWRGETGHGGAGGAGGNPSTRSKYKKSSGTSSSNVSLLGIGGSNSANTNVSTLVDIGEKAGGGGGAGGSGGCGGEGGQGGQGGGSSVGVLLVDSVLRTEATVIATGTGGSGAAGGLGSAGGIGANGSQGGAGKSEGRMQVNGGFTGSSGASFFTISGYAQSSGSWEEGYSATQSGEGGRGGRGGNGGKGGNGGAGAGGASIGVIVKGDSSILGQDLVYELGEGGAAPEEGFPGVAIQIRSL